LIGDISIKLDLSPNI
jgi:hypothetical protein